MLLHDAKYSNRFVVQAYCVNRFKYEQSDFVKHDVGWDVWKAWVEMGYAKKFAEIFSEDMPLNELYNKVITASPPTT